MQKKIAVFCSASFTIDPKYNKVAREFVRAASLCGYGIISGGTIKGTMGEISDELASIGGFHRGVIPRFMEQYVYPDLTEVVWTDTMAQRKVLLREGTEAVVALPGGIGTLDEVMDTFACIHLKQYDGEIFMLNHEGFYEPLRQLLQHYVDENMLVKDTMSRIHFADTPGQLIEMLQE
ncbi:MAG: TIGR00730 family Rossman fold protein [Bacteroidales bacterium]|nr:TIGR00730 family Rossman fold protein [Bacteroidales bacterium]